MKTTLFKIRIWRLEFCIKLKSNKPKKSKYIKSDSLMEAFENVLKKEPNPEKSFWDLHD